MHFCPRCGNMLVLSMQEGSSAFGYNCPTCPYTQALSKHEVVKSMPLRRKVATDVMAGDELFAGRDQITVKCPECKHDRAYYIEMQIRSADEPATIFYKCVNCKCQWSDR